MSYLWAILMSFVSNILGVRPCIIASAMKQLYTFVKAVRPASHHFKVDSMQEVDCRSFHKSKVGDAAACEVLYAVTSMSLISERNKEDSALISEAF